MPIYVYEVIDESGTSNDRFEVQQSMTEAALLQHPVSGKPVRRVLQAPNLGIKHTAGKTRRLLDNANVEKAGFTKYEKDKGTGTYHRVAGKQGPESFQRPL